MSLVTSHPLTTDWLGLSNDARPSGLMRDTAQSAGDNVIH
jgi:hypothetical protein